MHLQIRDPKARELARKIAQQRHVSMTEAVVQALEIEYRRVAAQQSLAVQAFADYGKGRGHPAQLNLADCLSYACAKARGIPLLYKGNDFTHTDLG